MRIVGLALLLTVALAAPAAAAGFPENSAVLLASSDEQVTQGIPHAFTDSNATFSATGFANDVTIHVHGTGTSLPDTGNFDLEFAARPGSTLKLGLYKNVELTPLRTNRAGMDIAGPGGSCSALTGWFEVKDIATDANGVVTRLQVLYEQHCDGAQPAVWGEIRYGLPATGNAVVTPSELIVPETTFGAPTNRAAVVLLVVNPFSISEPTFTGRNAAEFARPGFACGGSCPPFDPNGPFAAGDVGAVGVEFTPQRAGTRIATLNISDSLGDSYAVPISASTSR